MEPSSPSVQYQQFQLCQLPSNNVEKDATRIRRTLNLVSKTVASSSTAQSSSASNCPVILKAPSQSLSLVACVGRPAAEDSNPNDAASSSQVWQSDVKANARAERPAATETNQNLDFLASAGKPAAEGSGIVDADSEWPNNFQISVAYVPHLEKKSIQTFDRKLVVNQGTT